jgi:hypothetical protein
MTKRFTRRFAALPREERTALIDAKETNFLERLARKLEAFGPATEPSPRDRAIPGGPWRTGKENPKSHAVRTPAGVFDSVRQASKAFDLSRSRPRDWPASDATAGAMWTSARDLWVR